MLESKTGETRIYFNQTGTDMRGTETALWSNFKGWFKEWYEEYHDFSSPYDYCRSRELTTEEIVGLIDKNCLTKKLDPEGYKKYLSAKSIS